MNGVDDRLNAWWHDRITVNGDCWEWNRSRTKNGYGKTWTGKRLLGAHCVAYTVAYGPYPPGLNVLHRCDNRACVRPSHLFLGTQGDNIRDAVAKGRDRSVGERNPMAKLTAEKVAEIRRRLPTTMQKTLAAEFGVGRGAIEAIANGKTWRHC